MNRAFVVVALIVLLLLALAALRGANRTDPLPDTTNTDSTFDETIDTSVSAAPEVTVTPQTSASPVSTP